MIFTEFGSVEFKNILFAPRGKFKRSMKVALKGSTCHGRCVLQPGQWSLRLGVPMKPLRIKREGGLGKSAELSAVHHTGW